MPKTKLNLDKLISRTKIYLVVIAIILVILCVVEPKAIIPSILAYIAIFVYTIWSNNKRKTEISEHINELTVSVDKAAQSTIINSPFPLVVLETNGNIIWKSSNFIKEFANIDTGTTLTDIIKLPPSNIPAHDRRGPRRNCLKNAFFVVYLRFLFDYSLILFHCPLGFSPKTAVFSCSFSIILSVFSTLPPLCGGLSENGTFPWLIFPETSQKIHDLFTFVRYHFFILSCKGVLRTCYS